MIVHSVRIVGYRAFSELPKVRLGPLATIVGPNDTGKSSILYALKLFFDDASLTNDDLHRSSGKGGLPLQIEVAFSDLPESIQIEDGVDTSPEEERIVDADAFLRIRKTYDPATLKPEISLIVHDFAGEDFFGLAQLKEDELNRRCQAAGVDAPRSGRGITNKSKRQRLREKAVERGMEASEQTLSLSPKSGLWKAIQALLPPFHMFEADTRLSVGETKFQSAFRPVVAAAVERPEVLEARDGLQQEIEAALQSELDTIFEHLQRHTDGLVALRAAPQFSWDKAVNLDILGRDLQDVDVSFERRGSGMRRLLMVAFFQHLAHKGNRREGAFIFAVEEPENCLHPALQRELVLSFRELADLGYQIILTTHSPTFAGASPTEDLVLVTRAQGIGAARQSADSDEAFLSEVAQQLGVEPADQITGYNCCVFVEGPDDVRFWHSVAATLQQGGQVSSDLEAARVGFVMCGGDCLKHWINLRAMARLNRRFLLVLDSDRESVQDPIPERKRKWKSECEAQGGECIVLRKREIENYLHPDALARSGCCVAENDGFVDMKALHDKKVIRHATQMTCDEILAMDSYHEDGVEHHELKEIVEKMLQLADANAA